MRSPIRKRGMILFHVGYKKSKRFGLFILALVLGFSNTLFAATVDSVRIWNAPDSTRLVFDLSSPVNHKMFTLKSPDRLVIDINDSSMKADIRQIDFSGSPIAHFRHGQRQGDNLRIVLDMKKKVHSRSFFLKAQSGKKDRLVIDLDNLTQQRVKTVASATAEPKQARDIIITLDAGHGGEDPGAVGPKKLYEKDIVLKIAKELKALIDQAPGYTATMTRTGDYFVPLRERSKHARNVRADLFISIHADGFHNPKARGAAVFALSLNGATSESARILAARENNADIIGGVGNVAIDDMEQDLAQVIVDLSMTATLASSLDVGERVLNKMGKIARLHKGYIEQAGFLVLKSPDVPSILVETGLITNPEEARKLNSLSHRKKLAKSIFIGVEDYFQENPPTGTLIAKNQKDRGAFTYVVSRGDTLSDIAQRYGTSVSALKRINRLSDASRQIGQKLSIPRG